MGKIVYDQEDDSETIEDIRFDSNWRSRFTTREIFDDELKGVFLENLSRSDRIGECAKACGVTLKTVRRHMEEDEEFANAVSEARELYASVIMSQVYRLSVIGIDEPIVGGKDRDEVVAYKKVYATNLLAMEARRVNPEYRDKSDVRISGQLPGVLMVPLAPTTSEEWEQKYESGAKGSPELE